MKKIILISLVSVFLGSVQLMAQNNSGFDKSWDQRDTFTRPHGQDKYGPGIYSDATGKPFTWQTNDGQTVPPGGQVKPDGYGLGVGQDQFGRPVKPKTWP